MSEKKTNSPPPSSGKTSAAKSPAKKAPSKAQSSAGKSTGAAKKNTASKSAVATERQKRIMHRSIRAGVYLFLAFLGVLSLFNIKGFMLDWYRSLFGALIGYGYYLTPLVFIYLAVMLIIRMKNKVRAREISAAFIPMLFGSMGHMVRDISQYPSGFEGLKRLCQTGASLTSGGLISGSLGRLLKAAVSAGGGIFICFIALVVCCFITTGTNPIVFLKKLRPSPEEDIDDEEDEAETGVYKKGRGKSIRTPISQQKEQAVIPENYDFPEKRRPAADKPVTAEIRKNDAPAAKSSPFIDFFRKDKPAQAEKPARKDPTAPVVPEYESMDVELSGGGKAPASSFADILRENGSSAPAPKPAAEPKIQTPSSSGTAPLVEKIGSSDIPPFDFEEMDKKAKPEAKAPSVTPAFDIFTEDNPPPPEMSLDEKRQAAGEAHEKAAENNDVGELLTAVSNTPITEQGQYIYPPLSLLTPGDPGIGADHDSIVRCAERLVDTLKSFNIEAAIVNVTKGPTVTRYELQLQRGVKFSKVTSLSDDIALSLGAASVRIAPIPSNNSVGIEVPNDVQEVVSLRDILQNKAFSSAKSKLSFAVGKDIAGQCVVGDVAKMPHMLIAGTTGSGKSVCINSILISLIYNSTHEEVRLIMVDPKMIELGMYNGIPHLLIPVVTDPKKAAGALNWAVGEMMRRYRLLSEHNVRTLEAYNDQARANGEPTLPQIVIVIDELADLMFVAAREVEESIARIAQMARAAGMHLIIATQRPSADVITGIMKANIPSRVAFAVASQIESRIILDQTGAEKLIGRGDMLYNPLGAGKPQRVQGCFISTKEVESVIEFVKNTGTVEYSQEIMDHIERQAEAAENGNGEKGNGSGTPVDGDDPLLLEAISVVVERGEASTSLLQRKLKLGYARAARLIDIMEERGIVGPFEGSKPRSVTLTRDQWKEMQLRMQG